MENIKLKRHETFSIREGWLEKAINIIKEYPDCFKGNEGPKYFGLGSNMCKSLRYWCIACDIAEFSQKGEAKLTDNGRLLYEYDKYLDDDFSWWMLHFWLCKNEKEAPIFNMFFNMDYKKFDKTFLFNMFFDEICVKYLEPNKSSLESDISIVLKSYYSNDLSNPEDNLSCPFGKLKLLNMIDTKTYEKQSPSMNSLDYRIVYLALLNVFENTDDFNVEDIGLYNNNPMKIFNLTKSSMFVYLDEMKKAGYLSVVKTAGLNTVHILDRITYEEAFKSYFNDKE